MKNLTTALQNLCGEGAIYNWECFNEHPHSRDSLCKTGDKCVWCEARDILCNAVQANEGSAA